MDIDFAHVRIGSASVAIFDADAQDRTHHGRQQVLADLTARARMNKLRVDRSVLVFTQNGRQMYFGDPDLVRYLSQSSIVLRWTHRLTV